MKRWLGDYWPETLAALLVLLAVVTPGGRRTLSSAAAWGVGHVPPRISASIAGVGAVVAVVLPTFLEGTTSTTRAHLILTLACVQIVATGLPLVQQNGAVAIASSATTHRTRDFTRTLLPLVGLVQQITEETRSTLKDHKRGQAQVVALTAAATLLGGKDDVRASFFAVERSAPTRLLVPVPNSSVGRSDMASTRFDETTPLGRTVFELLDRREVGRCSNIATSPPVGWAASSPLPKWRSFVSAPVVWKGQLLGMLTVDSLAVDDFTDAEDPPLATTLAGLLAIALRG